MSIACQPMLPEHLEFLEPDPELAGLKANIRPELVLGHGEARAWVDTARVEVLALAGYVTRRPGVAWMWFLPSRRGSRMLLRFARAFRGWIGGLDSGIRVEAHVLAGFEAGNRWAEMLGFERENGEPLRLWDGIEDYNLYARVT